MEKITIPRWFYDDEWNCPLFDIHITGTGHKKRVSIKIEKIKETEKAVLCYVDLIRADGTTITFNCVGGEWIPKKIIEYVEE